MRICDRCESTLDRDSLRINVVDMEPYPCEICPCTDRFTCDNCASLIADDEYMEELHQVDAYLDELEETQRQADRVVDKFDSSW